MLVNQLFADISQFEAIGCLETPLSSDMSVFNTADTVQDAFTRTYGLLTINTPAKKRALLDLMHEYAKLPSTDRASFDQWLLTKSAQQR